MKDDPKNKKSICDENGALFIDLIKSRDTRCAISCFGGMT